MGKFAKWGWKTLLGGATLAIGIAGSPAGVGIFGKETATLIQSVGVVLGAVGITHKAAKIQDAIEGK